MISEYKKTDASKILYIINDASLKYKGIIPNDCWNEPYMSEQELINEFDSGVRMYGYHHNSTLIGVIGIQEVKDVILIRHAYTLSSYQGKGAGSALLEYLLKKKSRFSFVGWYLEGCRLGNSILSKIWFHSSLKRRNNFITKKILEHTNKTN